MVKTFFGGAHPPTYKSLTKDKQIRQAAVPKKVVLPLSQHTGKPSQPVVKPGDHVEAGAKVAQAAGFISSNLHSPVNGTIKAIEQAAHPALGMFQAIIIESDTEQKAAPGEAGPPVDIEAFSAEKIVQIIADAGIVGLGGAAFPTHVKLSPPKEKKIDTLIVNGAECEPYLTCDYRLMLERPEGIIKGALLLCKALGVNNCIIAIEDNKPDAIEAMWQTLNTCHSDGAKRPKNLKDVRFFAPLRGAQNDMVDAFRMASVPTKYPQGAEKQLIKTLLNREVPSSGLPFDVGVVVQNVATCLAVHEAVVLNKPLYERVLTVSGDCIKEPANLLAKIGTPVRDLVEGCGGFVKEPLKVIFGGPMMGVAQWTLDVPVLKGTSGVLFLSKDAVDDEEEGICVRCGGCVSVCPAGIVPTSIYYAALNNNFNLAGEYNALDCIECGCCSFQCPARLQLAGMIKYAKTMIRNLS